MSKTIRFKLTSLALVLLLPLGALAQSRPPSKVVHPTSEARWNKLFQAARTLANEGMEVGRITPAEKKQIDDFITQMNAFIAKAKQGGISEAEEDGIDGNLAQLYALIASNLSDVQRKAAAGAPAAAPRAVHATSDARWAKLFQAAARLVNEGVEVGRITPAEKTQIEIMIQRNVQTISAAKAAGISEAEEDRIDANLAQLYAMIASNMSDVQRKAQTAGAAGPRAVHATSEARWNRLFQAARTLANEGMEVGRITAAEKKQIDDTIAQDLQIIAKAKQGGITEAEEDRIDATLATLYGLIARNMSDVQRKAVAGAAGPRAVHATSEARWNKLFQAARTLANEGMEVGRITAAEKKQIDDTIARDLQIIAKAKQGGITEAEEDQIDATLATLYGLIARNMSDVQRKAQTVAAGAGVQRVVHATSEARWTKLFQAASVLANEGMEFGRITAAEKKQIDDFIAQTYQFIMKAKQGGISEAEEDGVDGNVAQLYALIARNMSDVQRKAAPVRR